MLAGNWPYYTGEPHPTDEMLTARLRYSVATQTCEDDLPPGLDTDVQTGQEDAKQSTRRRKKNVAVEGLALARCSRESLECLATGLEGRTGGRPLSLLMDQLQHPCVDVGMDVPSLLTWQNPSSHKVIEHVVLGKGPPGGAWHVSFMHCQNLLNENGRGRNDGIEMLG